MKKLLPYLSSLSVKEREAFVERCGTSIGYLRKAASIGQNLSEGLCLRIAAESHGALQPEDLRDDVEWSYLRQALANTAQTATENVAQGV